MAPAFLTLGRFVPGESFVHRLDARAKLLAAAILATATVWSASLPGQALVAVLLVLAFGTARLPGGVLAGAFRSVLWLLVFVALANLAWSLVSRHPSWAGASTERFVDLALLLVRLLNLVLLAVLFTSTTVPVDAAEALERLLRPLRALRVPVHELGMLLVLSLSFIPIFLEEAKHLAAAHRMKMGASRWGFRHRARAVVPLLVPLFLSVVRRGDELAVALDARCFVPGAPRTSLVPGRAGVGEVVALAASALVLVGSVWL
ncbi:MAG: energy-coupling factor transporter transmembrane component T family protein [Candidatus Krumholzibacteriia bacterium]